MRIRLSLIHSRVSESAFRRLSSLGTRLPLPVLQSLMSVLWTPPGPNDQRKPSAAHWVTCRRNKTPATPFERQRNSCHPIARLACRSRRVRSQGVEEAKSPPPIGPAPQARLAFGRKSASAQSRHHEKRNHT